MSNLNNCNCFNGISKLNRCEILALVSSVSMLLSEGLDEEDLEMLGALLTAIGDMIAAYVLVSCGDDDKDDTQC